MSPTLLLLLSHTRQQSRLILTKFSVLHPLALFQQKHLFSDWKFEIQAEPPVNVSSNWITRSIGNFQPYMVPTAWNYCVWSVEKIWKILCRENNAWEFSYQHINHFQRSQNKINSYFSYFWTRFQKNVQTTNKMFYNVHWYSVERSACAKLTNPTRDTIGLWSIQSPRPKCHNGFGLWYSFFIRAHLVMFSSVGAYDGEF